MANNFLDKAQQPRTPDTSCFYGNWIEAVHAGQIIVLGDFVTILILIIIIITIIIITDDNSMC